MYTRGFPDGNHNVTTTMTTMIMNPLPTFLFVGRHFSRFTFLALRSFFSFFFSFFLSRMVDLFGRRGHSYAGGSTSNSARVHCAFWCQSGRVLQTEFMPEETFFLCVLEWACPVFFSFLKEPSHTHVVVFSRSTKTNLSAPCLHCSIAQVGPGKLCT